MRNQPAPEELNRLPGLHETYNTLLRDKMIHQHYFLGATDWYMAEYCPKTRIFFGYEIMKNDHRNADWRYPSLDELLRMNMRGMEVNHDLHWATKRFDGIEGIRRGYQYKWDRQS